MPTIFREKCELAEIIVSCHMMIVAISANPATFFSVDISQLSEFILKNSIRSSFPFVLQFHSIAQMCCFFLLAQPYIFDNNSFLVTHEVINADYNHPVFGHTFIFFYRIWKTKRNRFIRCLRSVNNDLVGK